MKKQKLIFRISAFTLLLSLVLIGYAVYHIQAEKSSIEKNIQLWEQSRQVSVDKEASNTEAPAAVKVEAQQAVINKSKFKLMGKLVFEATGEELPLIHGTDHKRLAQGAGFFTASALPGDTGNCLIFGHRDGVFKNLGKLKPEDYITVETETGSFRYKVREAVIVDEMDESILQESNASMLTLVTCYPFNYVGTAPQRYIVKAILE